MDPDINKTQFRNETSHILVQETNTIFPFLILKLAGVDRTPKSVTGPGFVLIFPETKSQRTIRSLDHVSTSHIIRDTGLRLCKQKISEAQEEGGSQTCNAQTS